MKVQCQTIQPRINAKEKLIPGWHLEFQLHWNFEKIKASCKLCNLWELNKVPKFRLTLTIFAQQGKIRANANISNSRS